MGYYANLYTVELSESREDLLVLHNAYEAEVGLNAYFSWIQGSTPSGMRGYAKDTIFCNQVLHKLPPYPRSERVPRADGLIDVQFNPVRRDAAVVVHVVLPGGYVPDRRRTPFIYPKIATAQVASGRVMATFSESGPTHIRFRVRPLQPDESLAHFELAELFDAAQPQTGKLSFEVNLGIVKFAYEF